MLRMRGWSKLHNEELHNLYSLPSTAVGFDRHGMKYAWEIENVHQKT